MDGKKLRKVQGLLDLQNSYIPVTQDPKRFVLSCFGVCFSEVNISVESFHTNWRYKLTGHFCQKLQVGSRGHRNVGKIVAQCGQGPTVWGSVEFVHDVPRKDNDDLS